MSIDIETLNTVTQEVLSNLETLGGNAAGENILSSIRHLPKLHVVSRTLSLLNYLKSVFPIYQKDSLLVVLMEKILLWASESSKKVLHSKVLFFYIEYSLNTFVLFSSPLVGTVAPRHLSKLEERLSQFVPSKAFSSPEPTTLSSQYTETDFTALLENVKNIHELLKGPIKEFKRKENSQSLVKAYSLLSLTHLYSLNYSEAKSLLTSALAVASTAFLQKEQSMFLEHTAGLVLMAENSLERASTHFEEAAALGEAALESSREGNKGGEEDLGVRDLVVSSLEKGFVCHLLLGNFVESKRGLRTKSFLRIRRGDFFPSSPSGSSEKTQYSFMEEMRRAARKNAQNRFAFLVNLGLALSSGDVRAFTEAYSSMADFFYGFSDEIVLAQVQSLYESTMEVGIGNSISIYRKVGIKTLANLVGAEEKNCEDIVFRLIREGRINGSLRRENSGVVFVDEHSEVDSLEKEVEEGERLISYFGLCWEKRKRELVKGRTLIPKEYQESLTEEADVKPNGGTKI